MDALVMSKEREEEELTVSKALVNNKRKGKMGLLNLCVIFTCYFLSCNFYGSMF